MKKLLLVAMLLVSTLTFAHERNREEKKEMYDVIRTQLDEGKINVQTAQKMWQAYLKCCK
jgi:predicted nucleic-acid-binding protein